MLPFVESLVRQVTLTTLLDIAITALFIYWLFSLIRGTRAVTLVIGVSILLGVYALAQFLQLRLFTQILQAGAVVGLFALVVVFQPELRRGLERIGRVGTFGWLLAPSEQRTIEHVAGEVAKAAGQLSREGHGMLIVLERETGLEEIAESGIMIHADLSSELLCTIFAPRTGAPRRRGRHPRRPDPGGRGAPPAHRDGAVGAVRDATPGGARDHRGHRRGRRRRLRGERPDERGRARAIVRVPSEAQLQRALSALLEAPAAPPGLSRRRSPGLRGRARSRFRIRTTPARAETPALAAGVPGSGSAATSSAASADTGPDSGGPQDGIAAGGSPGGVASVDSTRVPSTPSPATQAKPEAPNAEQDGTGTAAVVARR